jgi:hypothetical protein
MRDPKFLSRRSFLRGTAGATLALPLLESIGSGPLQAQEAPVRRFFCFHCSSGVDTDRFRPPVGALSAASLSGLSIEALAPYADRLLVPRGIHGYPVGTWTGHVEGTGQALTAAKIDGDFAQGTSIDHIIARQAGREPLVLKPGGRDLGVAMFNSISYSAPGQLVAAESDPFRIYRAMMGMGASVAGPDREQSLDAIRRRRQSVIDLVRSEFLELRSLDLSRADREKLERHAALVRDVEVQMTASPDLVSCGVDQATAAQLEGLDRERVEANENFPISARLHGQLAVLALACRYTPAVVLQWGAAVAGSPMYRWDGMTHNYRHHPLSHGTSNDFNDVEVTGYKDMLAEIDRWNVGELKKLLDLMDGYDEGGGRSLLDNTVTLYSNEFSHGQGHTTGDLPYMLIGGAGYFKLGQSIVVQGGKTDIAGEEQGTSNKLLATVLNAVGVPTPSFSDGPPGEFDELKA